MLRKMNTYEQNMNVNLPYILTFAAVEYFIKNVYVGRKAYFILVFWITYEMNKLFIFDDFYF